MNSSDPIDLDSVFEEKAAEWLFEREHGFTPARAQAFLEWCNERPHHAEAVARVEQTLLLLDQIPAARVRLEKRLGLERSTPRGIGRIQPVLWTVSTAAALLFGLTIWQFSSVDSTPAIPVPAAKVYTSDPSQPRRVALSDGSVVDLNAKSNLEVRFSDAKRHLDLTAGEAHFRVTPNRSRPFIVNANGVTIRAVGTAFNVRLRDDEVDVLVTEGKVAISRINQRVSQSEPILPILVAGERTLLSPTVGEMPRVEAVAPDTVRSLLSWQERMNSFADVPLREMVARMNRFNSPKLILEDPVLGERKIGGVIDLREVNAFVLFLQQEGGVVAERNSDGDIVLRRAP